MKLRIGALLCALVLLGACMTGGCKQTQRVDRETAPYDFESKTPDFEETTGIHPVDPTCFRASTRDIRGVFQPLFAESPGDCAVSHLLFLPLVGVKANLTADFQDALLESAEVDGDVLHCTIREGMTWSDGTPVTSSDVRFTIETLMSPFYTGPVDCSTLSLLVGASDLRSGKSKHLEGFREIDLRHFDLCFTKLVPSMLLDLSFRPVPEHVYRSEDFEAIRAMGKEPVGSGAYRLSRWETGQFAVLVRRDDFPLGKPITPSIFLRDIPEDRLADILFHGDLDLAEFEQNSPVMEEGVIREQYTYSSSIENRAYALMTSRLGSFEDRQLRRYLLSLLAEDESLFEAQQDYRVSHSIVSPANRAFVDPLYDAPLVPESSKKREDGRLLWKDAPVTVHLYVEQGERLSRIGQEVQRVWETAGCKVVLHAVDAEHRFRVFCDIRDNKVSAAYLFVHDDGFFPNFVKCFSGMGYGRFFGLQGQAWDASLLDLVSAPDASALEARKWAQEFFAEEGLAIGFGSPIRRMVVRSAWQNVYASEHLSWYDGDVWNIRHQSAEAPSRSAP